MAYRRSNLGASILIGADSPQTNQTPHVLHLAPRPVDGNGNIKPAYSGHELMYGLYAKLPYFGQFGATFDQWAADPDRNGPSTAHIDQWRTFGRGGIASRFSFIQESNTDIADVYDTVIGFSSNVLNGMVESSQYIVDELLSWPSNAIPPEIITAVVTYLQEWTNTGAQARTAIEQANGLLKSQLKISSDTLDEAIRFVDTLGESYESEIQTLRAKVRELELEVIRLAEENIKLREQLEAKSKIYDNLLKLIREGGAAAEGVLESIEDVAKAGGAGLAFGGVTAILIYGALGLGAFFLLRKR